MDTNRNHEEQSKKELHEHIKTIKGILDSMKDVLDELESKVNTFRPSIIAEGNNLLRQLTTTFRNVLIALRSISR